MKSAKINTLAAAKRLSQRWHVKLYVGRGKHRVRVN